MKISLEKYEQAAAEWRKTLPGASHEIIHQKALAHLEHQYNNAPWWKRWWPVIVSAIFVVLMFLLLFAPHC